VDITLCGPYPNSVRRFACRPPEFTYGEYRYGSDQDRHHIEVKGIVKGISARQQGDTYQERAFWLKACRLFQRHTKVAQVGYEITDLPHFDDVAVFYSEPILDAHGESISADYYQLKWHVDYAGSLTCDAMIDPSFVGSKQTSLLQGLYKAVTTSTTQSQCARFNFVTTWSIRNDNILAKLVGGRDGEIRLEKLFGSNSSNPFRRLRQKWSDHLGVDEDELRSVLARLRICASSFSLDRLTRTLSNNLVTAGLCPIEYGRRSNPYDSLIKRLHAEGRSMFSMKDIQNICEQEELWVGTDIDHDTPLVGIRSFLRFAEHMEDEVDHMLDLVSLFDGRQIEAEEYWNAEVGPRIHEFITGTVAPLGRFRLQLSAHSSIAFATGYELNPKSGVEVSLLQNSAGGSSVWKIPVNSMARREDLWRVSERDVNPEGCDVGIVLSVTHNACPEVLDYVKGHLPQIGRMLMFTVQPDIGPTSVTDGHHAWRLAQEVVNVVREIRPQHASTGQLHVFGAAPNGLTFFLGRLACSLGPIQLYEHEFETNQPVRYRQSLSLSPTLPSK